MKMLMLLFSPQVNVLIGKNARGKTNLLESIYVLAMARSHKERAMMKW